MKLTDISKITYQLAKIAEVVINDESLSHAEETGNNLVLQIVANALVAAENELKTAADLIERIAETEIAVVDESTLEELAAMATELDSSDDPKLQKQASLLDEILLTLGASKKEVAERKAAQDIEIERLKALRSEAAEESDKTNPYKIVKDEHDKQSKVNEAKEAIKAVTKEYRIMEAPLNTRTCPDHPGAQMARVAEHTWQCSMDKAIYNYEMGYTTMKGNRVPGGNVANQSLPIFDQPNEFTSFDTREGRLGRI